MASTSGRTSRDRPPTLAHRVQRAVPTDDNGRPDLMGLLWALIALEVTCGFLVSAIGWWALILAGLFVVGLAGAIAWSTGGEP